LKSNRLRQSFSARLEEPITEVRKVQLSLQELSVPICLPAARQFSSQRRAEVEAYSNYLLASLRLEDFFEEHSYRVN
jgi:hypothetical protein